MADYYVDGSGDAIPVLVNLNAYKGVPPLEPLRISKAVSTGWLTESPISLDDMKTYLRVDGNDEDGLITDLMHAAVTYCQDVSNNAHISTTVTVTFADFPPSGVQALGVPAWSHLPVRSPAPSITYYDTAGVQQTLADITDIRFYAYGNTVVVLPTSGEWPSDYDRTGPHPIVLTYTIQSEPTDASDRQFFVAMQMLVGHWYATRDAVCDGNPKEIPFGVNALLQNNTFYGGLS